MGARQITVSCRLPEPYRQQFGSACGNHPQTAAKSIIASFARMSTDSDHVLSKNHEFCPAGGVRFFVPEKIVKIVYDPLAKLRRCNIVSLRIKSAKFVLRSRPRRVGVSSVSGD
jgi:hypothetical protein